MKKLIIRVLLLIPLSITYSKLAETQSVLNSDSNNPDVAGRVFPNICDTTKTVSKKDGTDDSDEIYALVAGIGGTNIGISYGFGYTIGFKNNTLVKVSFKKAVTNLEPGSEA